MTQFYKEEAIAAFPQLETLIECEHSAALSVWNSPLSTGKLLEFLSLLSIFKSLRSMNIEVGLDQVYLNNPELFYLRNEIPFHHNAQAGHDAGSNGDITLQDRFLASILPRYQFQLLDQNFMVYREGNPLHVIQSALKRVEPYKERPDLILVDGYISVSNVSQSNLEFTHSSQTGTAKYTLSIKNSNILPLIEYSSSDKYEIYSPGVIECSVSKTKICVDSQLDDYSDLFSAKENKPECLFIHGKATHSKYPTLCLDMQNLVADISSDNTVNTISKFLALIKSK